MIRHTSYLSLLLVTALFSPASAQLVQPEPEPQPSELLRTLEIPEANQGIAVDAEHFYAVDNRAIAKYDKRTGKRVDTCAGAEDGPIIHLDSGVVLDGLLYAAHSNYPESPMTSSVEIFDVETMAHVDTHSSASTGARSSGSTGMTASGGRGSPTITASLATISWPTATSTGQRSSSSTTTGSGSRPGHSLKGC